MRYTALYGRQSLDVRDSISVPMQIKKARAECGADEICREYTDRGYSGKNTKRPAFIQLMQDIKDGLVCRVIVYKLDRFSRSILDFAEAWAVMERHHVEFLSVNERFDTSTPMGKAMLFILMVFAQMERETISERVTDNYYERAKYGGWLGGPAPFGTSLCRITDRQGKQTPSLSYNEEQFASLKKVFYEYAERPFISLGRLAGQLREEGIASPSGGAWNNVTLSRILKNPVYVQADADIYRYYKLRGVTILQDIRYFDGTHAGMLISKRAAKNRKRTCMEEWTFTLANWAGRIPSEVWLACQAKLENNRQIGKTGAGKHSWLSGIAKCGHCGRAMVVTCYKNGRYFNCSGHRDGICPKEKETIYVDEIEQMVKRELTAVMDRCADEPYIVEHGQDTANRQQMVKTEEEIENLISFISSGQAVGPAAKMVNDRLATLSEKLAKLREEELGKTTRGKRIKLQKIDFTKLDLEHQKEVAAVYLQKVLIYDNKSIEIVWNI